MSWPLLCQLLRVHNEPKTAVFLPPRLLAWQGVASNRRNLVCQIRFHVAEPSAGKERSEAVGL